MHQIASLGNPGIHTITALESLVEYSRKLGADESLVLRGGGNTSVKVRGADVAGRPIDVLLVKGTGSDLKLAGARDFPGLRLADLLHLRERDDLSDEEMVDYLARCKLDPSSPRPSIEALLHAFVPYASVFHSHADAILKLCNTPEPDGVIKEALGEGVRTVAYRRPGFRLSREVGDAAESSGARAVVLLNHGLVTWGSDPASAYGTHLELVGRAESFQRTRMPGAVFIADASTTLSADTRRQVVARLAPVLRGALSADKRVILTYDDEAETLAFVGSDRARRASAAGAATPDHILTTKNLPMWLDLPDDALAEPAESVAVALATYRASYQEYINRWRTDEPQLEPAPRVVLVPRIGLFAAGRDLRTAQVARDIYRHTMRIMAGAESLGGYRSLSEAEAFRAEYWPLELYKLALAPAERELERRVALVTGAGSGIGRAIALRLAAAGAHVIATDRDPATAAATCALIQSAGAAPSTAWALDVTRETAVDTAFERAMIEFGGIDVVVSNAGYAHSAPIEQLQLADWERSFAVNASAHFLVSRAALRLMRRQAIGGCIVFVVTKNVVAPGADFAAYSAAKAAEAQLARVAAIEGGPIGVRVNMVNPDAVFAETHLWDELRAERARTHNVSPAEIEDFYRKRSLLGVSVRPVDVAEAVLFLASDRSSRTTGGVIPVDGGVREAFLR